MSVVSNVFGLFLHFPVLGLTSCTTGTRLDQSEDCLHIDGTLARFM